MAPFFSKVIGYGDIHEMQGNINAVDYINSRKVVR